MELDISVTLNLNFPEAEAAVINAAEDSLKDVIVEVVGDAKENSPVSEMWPSIAKNGRRATGNNKDSISWALGEVTDEEGLGLEKLQGAVYSTSGYGGYLETGTSKMPARPYIKPAVDERFTPEEMAGRIQANLGDA
jgi:hypothetical protein